MAQQRPSVGEGAPEIAGLAEAQWHDAEVEIHGQNGSAAIDVAIAAANDKKRNDIKKEIRLFSELAIPTTLLNISFTLSPLMTASCIGLRFGKVYLSAFTLANLTGNLFTFSVLSGMFSAADTLSPQAFGKRNYPEIGLIAMRGIIAGVLLLVPINVFLVLQLEGTLVAMGQDPEASFHATRWYRIFAISLPFSTIYSAAWRFLSSQHVMRPLMLVSIFCCVVILPIALKICTDLFGFLGSAMAYVIFQAAQALMLLGYLWKVQPHVNESWPGLGCWRDALKPQPMMEYLHLGAGGILAQSEWIYWEALGLIIGKLGVIPLSVHTIPNQVIMAMCMAPFAFGTALSIRMGVTLITSVSRAKRIVVGTMAATCLIFGLLSIVMYIKSEWIFAIFTQDEEVMNLAQEVWWKVCLYNFNVVIFAILTGVATGLGMQWTLGAVNFFFLWLFGIPITYYSALVRGGGLDAAWTWINAPYAGMNISLLVIFVTTDWSAVRNKILKDHHVEEEAPSDGTFELLDDAIPAAATTEKTGLLTGDQVHQVQYTTTKM